WLSLVVGLYETAAIPVAGLHGDLVAQWTQKLVAHRGWEAAELDRRAVGADRVDPHRLLFGIDAGEPVEIRQPLIIIIGVLDPLDRLADLVRDKFERARAEDVLLVPAGVPVESLLLVDPAVGV